MSAIAGFWGFDDQFAGDTPCRTMLEALQVYGPDNTSVARARSISVGRNLFSLLPEDRNDRQPLIAGGGRFALVADLRLDNRGELGKALRLQGLAALSDADILFSALQRWGEGALDRIVGDYAFAFFDAEANRLLLVRDPLGQRPLFLHRGEGFLAFASMPKGLHALGEPPPAVDAGRVCEFLGAMHPLGPRSFHAGIDRVEPGHVVAATPDRTVSRRYWRPERRDLGLGSFDNHVEGFRFELDRAVACRLRGNEPVVASHLSGGWDSSAVTATAARLLAPGGTLVAFTSVPHPSAPGSAPQGRFADEGSRAAMTAALYPDIEHRLITGSRRSPIADLDLYASLYERPTYSLCNHVWLAQIRREARSAGARILLTGEIGNWTISASPVSLLADFVREGRWGAWWREAAGMRSRARIRGIAAASFGPWVPDLIWKRLRAFSSAPELARQSCLHPRVAAAIRRKPEARRFGVAHRPKNNFETTRDALFEMDWGEYRKGVLGGWGIDKRDATADRRLIEFCLSLPLDMLLHDGVRRPLARAALSDRLPPAILDESGKGYQASDWHEGLTEDLPAVSRLVEAIATHPVASTLIDAEALRALIRKWPSGDWGSWDRIASYRNGLLPMLSAGHFMIAASG